MKRKKQETNVMISQEIIRDVTHFIVHFCHRSLLKISIFLLNVDNDYQSLV